MQMNTATAFLDLDVIYGLNMDVLKSLRSFSDGKLRMAGGVLPVQDCGPGSCDNYFAGDNRANQTTCLTIMHSLFFRCHNKLADGLSKVNPTWGDHRLFYEARELLISIYQSITYNHWLVAYLGWWH